MNESEQKVVQYLNEAHASEVGLVSVLQSQIAMSPQGSYREGLEQHLGETREHARRLEERLGELDQGGNPFQAFVGFSEAVIGQMVALSKAPFDLWRGVSGAEKVLKQAKDACAAEALEVATYTALERLATQVGDTQSARLAASIRRDEERMLQRILREIPKLTDAVKQAEIDPRLSHEITEAGAADAAREAGAGTRPAGPALRSGRGERRPNTVAGSRERLPIQRYGSLSTERIIGTLPELSQADLAKIDAYERSNENRDAVLTRISELRSAEPLPGYDQLGVPEIEAVLSEGDLERAQAVAGYERAHRNRPEVIRSAIIPARFVLSASR
ncbi:MAG: DUF892 family protein [Solirubrobacterales bacterium]|nr:DUF892 family protein [Solirubrobacterales bacterium]